MTTCPFCHVTTSDAHACTASRTVSSADFRAEPGKYAAAARLSGPITVLSRDGKPSMVVSVPGPSPVPCICCEESFNEILDTLQAILCANPGRVFEPFATGYRMLAKHNRFTIVDDDGRRVVGRWRDG